MASLAGWRARAMGLFRPKYAPKGMTYKEAKAAGQIQECAVWFARYQLRGRKIVESTGSAKYEEARTWLRKRLGAIANKEPVTIRADRVTFSDMAVKLREDYTTNEQDVRTLKARLLHLEAAFGAMKLAHLIPAHVERYKAD